jgi:Predicted unsaturated glucuronyl hydrolase involved in regulation of bacterial surface properties, and related proteins
MKYLRIVALVLIGTAFAADAFATQTTTSLPWSQRAANAVLTQWPEGIFGPAGSTLTWKYELGTLLQGMDAVWLNSADGRYYKYIKNSVDQLVAPDGTIPTYRSDIKELDSILMGRQLLLLYGVTQDKRYLTAAKLLIDQLAGQPRTASGGYWHKQRYPNQMWLDGLYMAEPFRAEYAEISHHPEEFNDITHQFALIEEHARDAKTGLIYHGWDESKQQRWANPETGLSPEFWGRAMGWYMMALVDTIPNYPENDPGRKQLIGYLQRDASALLQYQDVKSGLWYEVLDKGGSKGNYVESSASCMFVYALAKGVRLGFLPASFRANAERGYQGVLSHFIKTDGDDVSLTGTVSVGGLGGDPYRDGSYAYYLSEKVVTNDPKGVGAFLLAASEMENAENAKLGRGETVLMDGWFNSQRRTDAFGREVLFHYKWDTQDDPGYSFAGRIFRNFGVQTKVLDAEPTLDHLKSAQVFMIVSPDNTAKNPHPNYANNKDAEQIAQWVKSGGVLAILENDTSFADLDHFNVIAEKLGMHFNSVLRKHVIGSNWEQGKIVVDGSGPIFHRPHTLYVKDVCTLTLKSPAVPVMKEGEDIFMATAKYGKGTVIAFVDPWLYNEYTDGRKLPAEYQNYAGGVEFVRWLLEQVPKKK